MKVREISSVKGLKEWDKFVEKSPQGTIFHTSLWLKNSGDDFKIYAIYKGGHIFAGFVTGVKKIVGVKAAWPPLLTPWLGPIYRRSNSKYVTQISNRKEVNKIFAKKIKEDFDYFNLSFSPEIKDLQSYIWEGFSTEVKYTYRIKLDDLNSIWDSMGKSHRNDILRAKKDGIEIVCPQNFDTAFKLIEKTFYRQKKNIKFKKRAYKINDIFSKNNKSRLFLAIDLLGEPIAAVYIIWDNKTSYYLLGGYDFEKSHRGASSFAIWKAIEYSKKNLGLESFDFEGSMIQNIEKFFRNFGGRIVPHYSLTWGNKKGKCLFGLRKLGGRILRRLNLL
jgi:hypothetical protein